MVEERPDVVADVVYRTVGVLLDTVHPDPTAVPVVGVEVPVLSLEDLPLRRVARVRDRAPAVPASTVVPTAAAASPPSSFLRFVYFSNNIAKTNTVKFVNGTEG